MQEQAGANPNVGRTASSLQDFKKQSKMFDEGVLFSLPSGLVMKLRRPSLSKMIRDEVMPQPLVAAAVRISIGNKVTSPKDLSDNIKLMEFVLEKAIVEPVGITMEDIEALSEDDKAEAFMFIQRGLVGLDSFRQK